MITLSAAAIVQIVLRSRRRWSYERLLPLSLGVLTFLGTKIAEKAH